MDEATVRTRFSILTAVLISSAAICQDAGPGGSAGTAPSVRDLIEMRSIDSLVVSPNGRRLAFRLLSPSVRTDKVVAQYGAYEPLTSRQVRGKPRALAAALQSSTAAIAPDYCPTDY